ncbi:hypothetical protein HanXRQr2_Chr12g0545441 [Helianthus annuus]|uniref:Uncharacterized protein n=1 Tax=Helianthus annuus TaxID=4232 RepID=A0A251T2N0_HELAN|nr:hypothetical protein HanXRQr2_Chr12g0545441 [Helianthus annuus]
MASDLHLINNKAFFGGTQTLTLASSLYPSILSPTICKSSNTCLLFPTLSPSSSCSSSPTTNSISFPPSCTATSHCATVVFSSLRQGNKQLNSDPNALKASQTVTGKCTHFLCTCEHS